MIKFLFLMKPKDTTNSSSTMCIICWEKLEKFHKFYLLIEKAHAALGTTTISRHVKELTQSSADHLKDSNGCKEEYKKESSIEPKILMQQHFPAEYAMDNENCLTKVEYEDTLLIDKIVKPRRKRGRPPMNMLSGFKQSNKDPLKKRNAPKSLAKHIKLGKKFKGDISNEFNIPLDANNSGSDTEYEGNEGKSLYDTCKRKRKNPDKKSREEHDKMIAEHLKISCCLCKVPLDNFIALRKHFREEHNKRGFTICCNRKFFNRPTLVDHLNFHLDPNYFKCKFCAKVYSQRCTLERHVKVHMKTEQGSHHNCVECGKSFVGTIQLENYILTHAPGYEKKFSCSECGKNSKSLRVPLLSLYKANGHTKYIIGNDAMVGENSNESNIPPYVKYNSGSDTEYEGNEEEQPYETYKKKRKNPDKKTRKEHDKMIAEHLKISCCLCQVPLVNFIALRKHFREEHNKRGFIICCNKKFFNRPTLVDHLNFHLDPNYFKCKFCAKVYSERCTLDKHVKIHMKTEQGRRHNCVECGKCYVGTTQLENHKLTHAPDYEKKFSCSECGKSFTTLYNLNYHIQAIHHNKYAKICDICGKTIRNSFKLHMEKHDKKLATPVHCDVCGLRLINKRSLKQHKNSQHPVGGKTDHCCHICLKASASIRALHTHIRFSHETGYTHKCTLCDKAFKKPEVLKEHMATHTGNPLYYCPWCPKTFKSNGNMYSHRKNIHPEKWEALKRQKYVDTGLKEEVSKSVNAD